MTNTFVSRSLFLFFLIIISFNAAAQKTKAELQKEKQEQLQKIQEAEKILEQTKNEKQNSIGQLTALNQRISVQEELIASIREEINLLEKEIGDKDDIISALQEDVEELKEEYASMLYVAQKANYGTNKLTFLFSSASFTQLMMRIKYLQQYGHVRRKQAEQIQEIQSFIVMQTNELKSQKDAKNELLNEQIKENNQLATLKEKQNSLLANLQKEEKKLRSNLEESKKAIAKLDKMINDIIREEIEKAKLAEAAKANSATLLSNSFAENKARLPWPVPGFVSSKFGKHPHPVLKNIIIQNDGINIQTKKDAVVTAIFSGQVSTIMFNPGIGNTILIKHGDYFTVYSGLNEVFVKPGQQINIDQQLGKVATNSEGISELRFQIRKNQAALNPEAWLSRN